VGRPTYPFVRLGATSVGVVVVQLVVSPAAADVRLDQIEDIESLSLSDLLEQPVTSASRYAQKPGGSPILVSTIDADLINTLGYRTLGEALRGMRGVYTSNDRNYSYLGARGFSLPGDYNTRFALSIDNHRINDPIYGQGNTGAELGLPMIAVERIELIRGGAWSVHGESALLGAIQVVTPSGATRPGIRVMTTARASAETFEDPAGRDRIEPRGQDVAASYGVVRRGYDLFVAGAYAHDPGMSAIYMPELAIADEPCVGPDLLARACDGIVRGADGEEVGSIYAAIKKRELTIRTFAARRRKRAPTAAFGGLIGDALETLDTRIYGDVEYARSGERGDLVLRGTGDYYAYTGDYPYAYADETAVQAGTERVVNLDGSETSWWGLEARGRLKRERLGRYLSDLEIGGGGEARRAAGRQYNSEVIRGERLMYLDRTDRVDRAAVFAHASARAFDHLVGFAALRGDYYPHTVGLVVNPQLGLVLDGGDVGRVRATLSRGHRSPNLYESYFGAGVDGLEIPELQAEKSETREVSIERYLSPNLRLLVVGFDQHVTNLIALTESDDVATIFANVEDMRSHGIEAELEGRWDRFRLRTSYTQLRTRTTTGHLPPNSPTSLGNCTLLAPFAGGRGIVGVESWFVGGRLAFDHTELPPLFMTNVAVTLHRIVDKIDLTLGVTNLFDQRGGDPGSEEHRQSVIPHDPRIVWARLKLELP
jgi:outer membrane receptor for ferrienterochelin and colicins